MIIVLIQEEIIKERSKIKMPWSSHNISVKNIHKIVCIDKSSTLRVWYVLYSWGKSCTVPKNGANIETIRGNISIYYFCFISMSIPSKK
jgi:hypothetical protein